MEIQALVDDAMRDVENREVMIKAVGFAIAIITAAGVLLAMLAALVAGPAVPAATVAPAAPAVIAEAPAPPSAPSMPSIEADAPVGRHTVAAGETLAGLAQQYRVPVELLAADNGLTDPDRVGAGESLAIASPPSNVIVIDDGATLSGYAAQHSTTVDGLLELNPQITDADRITAGDGLRVATG